MGGSAMVYLGRKRTIEGFEWVAVKCLHQHLEDDEDIVRLFFVEAELLSRLDHPNISEILRYGTEGGVPFIVTRYLRGSALNGLIKAIIEDPAPVAVICWIIAEACAGLHHAHEARS